MPLHKQQSNHLKRRILAHARLHQLPQWLLVRVSRICFLSVLSERIYAAWTTCPYVIRDGKVNPDVRTLRGPGAINKFTQQAIYNVMAYILTKSDSYAETFVKAVDVFYLNSETHMNPNMNYGQVSRGPGPTGRQGTFTGVLDGRGHVKAVNAIQLLKALKHRSWTKDHDRKILQWMSDYNDWATKSDIGKKSQSRPKFVLTYLSVELDYQLFCSNHGTFFAAQMASTRMLVNDLVGARKIITDFFEHAFQDQIAASGEQPFEAVRTRPFHYRCFNLEALIVSFEPFGCCWMLTHLRRVRRLLKSSVLMRGR